MILNIFLILKKKGIYFCKKNNVWNLPSTNTSNVQDFLNNIEHNKLTLTKTRRCRIYLIEIETEKTNIPTVCEDRLGQFKDIYNIHTLNLNTISKQTILLAQKRKMLPFFRNVAAVVFTKKHILMLLDKYKRKWMTPGGRLERADRTDLDGMKREYFEEVSSKFPEQNLVETVFYHKTSTIIYLISVPNEFPLNYKQNNEVAKKSWISFKELYKIPIKKYVKESLLDLRDKNKIPYFSLKVKSKKKSETISISKFSQKKKTVDKYEQTTKNLNYKNMNNISYKIPSYINNHSSYHRDNKFPNSNLNPNPENQYLSQNPNPENQYLSQNPNPEDQYLSQNINYLPQNQYLPANPVNQYLPQNSEYLPQNPEFLANNEKQHLSLNPYGTVEYPYLSAGTSKVNYQPFISKNNDITETTLNEMIEAPELSNLKLQEEFSSAYI